MISNGHTDGQSEVLNPQKAFESIGYTFEKNTSLGQYLKYGLMVEIAGIIDESKKRVQISEQLSWESHKFTAAHELGHALLHKAYGLHRDRELNGAPIKGKRSQIEIEAMSIRLEELNLLKI